MKQLWDNIKVSVIVTIHNSEKYLEECINSACSQTLREIEIICVDGGSEDSSPEIIRKFQEKDARVRVINDQNTSYGHKINIGILASRGEYISILESDDKMDTMMLERLYAIAEKYKPDMVDADSKAFFEYKGRTYSYGRKKYSDNACYDHLIRKEKGKNPIISPGAIWTAIYKKDFLINKEIVLNESAGAAYQDSSFAFLTSVLADSLYHIDEPLYQYRIDNTGSSVKDNSKVFEIIGECAFLEKQLHNHNIDDLNIWRLFYIKKYAVYFWNACRLTDIEARENFLEKYKGELKKDIKKHNLQKNSLNRMEYVSTYLFVENEKEFLEQVKKNSNKDSALEICDLLEKITDQEIVIFGAGIRGERLAEILQQYCNGVKAFCDNSEDLHFTRKKSCNILPVEIAVKKFPQALYIITNYEYFDEMWSQLIGLGISRDKILIYT